MNIVFLGLAGVPYLQRACDTRIMSLANIIASNGDKVTIFNKYPVNKINNSDIDYSYPEGIQIIEVVDQNFTRVKFLKVIMILISFPREIFLLKQFNKTNKIDIFHIYSGHFIDVFIYYILAKLFRAKVVYHYEEFRSVIKRNNIYHLINGSLIDNFGYYFYDGAICISSFLQNHIESHAPKMPTIKIPPICDFDLFDTIKAKKDDSDYILFCGSAIYFDLIYFIIDTYNLSKCSTQKIKLILIVNGSESEMLNIKNHINANENIIIKSNLPYNDLIVYYKSAKALLIPLRNNTQDIARFPNKICEYTASGGVIITMNNGEIPFYFENCLNAVIANEYSIRLFSQKINWVLDHGNCLPGLKENAYKLGKQCFDVRVYKDSLYDFLHVSIWK